MAKSSGLSRLEASVAVGLATEWLNRGSNPPSSSNTVQGSVSLPHYRTLEVRPGRIS